MERAREKRRERVKETDRQREREREREEEEERMKVCVDVLARLPISEVSSVGLALSGQAYFCLQF